MRRETTEMRKVVIEQLYCAALLSVWVIVKDGILAGKMTARRPKDSNNTYVTFYLHKNRPLEEEYVYGYEISGEIDSQRGTKEGMKLILSRNSRRLKQIYGVVVPDSEQEISDDWQKYFREAGYDVVEAI